jgi:hypothetical protein
LDGQIIPANYNQGHWLFHLYAETEKGNKYWILDDPDNPIILKIRYKLAFKRMRGQIKIYFRL